ncbi:pollen-specific leucine-rich repeat extensin-like protein 4 [Iris pallida]|uniref:Pollen-specific leucine-rich repeat extensin-like protein 4 n=1 Tax=Iris pallida TaxID=29817 RepID=A0AAX6H8V8_IRIPA|nr:pollen-specific leucine-rich repeat extensin-like protein 4 [Iris pallida]
MGEVSESGRKAEDSPVEAAGDGQTRRRRRKENDRRARLAHHGGGSGRCCRWKMQARTLALGGAGVEGFVGRSLLVSVPCAMLPWKCIGRRPLGRCGGAGAAPPAKSGECSTLAWRTGRRPATRVLDRWGGSSARSGARIRAQVLLDAKIGWGLQLDRRRKGLRSLCCVWGWRWCGSSDDVGESAVAGMAMMVGFWKDWSGGGGRQRKEGVVLVVTDVGYRGIGGSEFCGGS